VTKQGIDFGQNFEMMERESTWKVTGIIIILVILIAITIIIVTIIIALNVVIVDIGAVG
jgi:hypothetical protein